MQVLMIAGNVGKDAQLRRTQSDEPVLSFTLAVNDGGKGRTTWYDCVIFGKRAEKLSNFISKGTKMVLTGRPSARAYEDKAYLGISVDQIEFMGGGSKGQGTLQGPDSSGSSEDLSDEIPF